MDRKISKRISLTDCRLLPSEKSRLKAKIPVLSAVDVRRQRIPLHQALLLELKEGNYQNAHSLFSRLLDCDIEQSKELINDKDLLKKVFDDLKYMEFATKEDELERIMQLSAFVKQKPSSLHWMADQLYAYAAQQVTRHNMKGSNWEAKVLFFYGKSLFDRAKFEKSTEILLKALNLNLTGGHEVRGGKIFFVISQQLVKSLIELSKASESENPKKALECALQSSKVLRFVPLSERLELEAKAETQVAGCLMLNNETKKAKIHFDFAVELAASGNFPQVEIDALVKMAELNECSEEHGKQVENLEKAIQVSKESSMPSTEADLCVLLAQVWIKQQESSRALERFSQACAVYKKLGEIRKLVKVQLLMAPLIGQ
jgi:tetratricopeptide (TPR) repeat protein